MYDAATPKRRSLCVAYSNVLNGFGVVIGATIGSVLISRLQVSFLNTIMFVSVISGFARYAVSLAMVPRIKEVRPSVGEPKLKVIPFISQILSIPLYVQNLFPIFRGIKRAITNTNFKKDE